MLRSTIQSTLRPLALTLGLLASLLVATPAQAQDEDPFVFKSDAGVITWQIVPDKAEDFELVWRVIRQRIDAQGGADLRARMQNLRMFRLDVPAGDALTYMFYIEPIMPGGSYSPTVLLFESKLFERGEADELYARMSGALAPGNAISTMPLRKTGQ